MGLTHVTSQSIGSLDYSGYFTTRSFWSILAPSDQWLRHRNSGESELNRSASEYTNLPTVNWQNMKYGVARISVYAMKSSPIRVIFGPESIEPILGVIALESAGFMVDPKNQTLTKAASASPEEGSSGYGC